MNKNAIKKFATEARRELISRVSQRALKYGISEKEVGNPNDDSVNGHLLSSAEKKQRSALIAQIKEKGYEQVMEEVAYTWFNRFSALRFMEVNGYLPTRVRVFTDENNAFKPQILTEAIHMELDGLDMEKVYAYKEANDDDELYKYLLITQCNALNSVLPGMFQKIADYTELLFPDNLLREGSVVQQMIELIPEEDWKDAVQIIGWLYQYYNSEKKDDVFAALKKNVKITKENIPAATQLFTPDWIVRYMVENSLGRLWVEGHPNDELKSQWKYYLEEAEQEPDVQAQLASIREEYKALKPEDILCIDPCSGSGHILAYMFDVLVQIYEAYGVDTRTAVASIVENNIYGLDIDDRAAQLAYFSVMMKACQYDKRFLRRKVQPHVYAIVESNHVDPNVVDYFCNGDSKLKETMDTIISELHDAKEYGSILTVTQQDWEALYARFDEIQNESVLSIYTDAALELKSMAQVAQALAQKYDVVVTNPPYMGASGMSDVLANYIKSNYPDSKGDLFAVFIDKCMKMAKGKGFQAMITQHQWMFLAGYEKLRRTINRHQTVSLAHLGIGTFEDLNSKVVQSVAFVIRNSNATNYRGTYHRLFEKQGLQENNEEKAEWLVTGKHKFELNQSLFEKIDGAPIAYWASSMVLKHFDGKRVKDYADARQGLITGDNDTYMRMWFEPDICNVSFSCSNCEETETNGIRWYPYAKGGGFRRWYGFNDYVVDWKNNGYALKNFKDSKGKLRSRPQNIDTYFREGLTWSALTTYKLSLRIMRNAIYGGGGAAMFVDKSMELYVLGFMNSSIAQYYLNLINPTINFLINDILSLPVVTQHKEEIEELVTENIRISKVDYDSFETSIDFVTNPLVKLSKENGHGTSLKDIFYLWEEECKSRISELRDNEERMNALFIDTYQLQRDVSPLLEDKEIVLHIPELRADVAHLISYAVGCMFGRYSLDVNGLAYAGGEWDASKYTTFEPDKDNIIPICDDEYFQDDIVGRFVRFVEVVYGKETLDENLKFIADALGGKGQPKDVIRNYFINDFYSDHCKMYQKRPIYWLLDSGKKNGLKCLIYMHRYQPDTIARIRTDYVHEQQARYRTAIADLENRIAAASTSERVKLNKKLTTLQAQEVEIRAYEEKIHHLADQMLSIDLDDGVKKNYEIFKDVLAKIK